MKDKIAFWFRNGIWSETMVRNAVVKKVISVDDYKEITGQEYK